MRIIKSSFFFQIFSFVAMMTLGLTQVHAQLSPSQELYYQGVEEANMLFQNNLFGSTETAIQQFLEKDPYREQDEMFWAKAKLYRDLSLIKSRKAKAEFALLKLVNEYSASIYGNLVNQEIADFYLAQENYSEASYYYDEIDYDVLDEDLFTEIAFKNGYSKFVFKNFDLAIQWFDKVIPFQNKYFYPSHYYAGMADYFTENPDSAIEHFKVLENSTAYKNRIPYLIAQLLFNKGEYEELIDYALTRISNKEVKNIKEIRGLVGQAYFANEDYENAIPHLAHYVDNTQKLRAEDFYQLGFAYYTTKQYDKAIKQFVEIANEDSELGQNANNYLAKSYVNSDDKAAALSAFKRTAEMNHIEGLAEEAQFNYAKLSAELGYDRDALEVLKEILPGSLYFADAQIVLSEILNNTKDYERALSFIDAMEMQSPLIQKTYQRIAYLYGMQFLLDEDFRQAEKYFLTSLKRPVDETFAAQANYRLASIYNLDFNYNKSIQYMNAFLGTSIPQQAFPTDVNMGNAHYIQGYNHLKNNDFASSRVFLSKAASFFQTSGESKLQMDALLRAADCYFRINNYPQAANLYADAIALNQRGTDYALYQKGIIEGLQGKPYEKLVTLDKLIERFPKSSLADFALFQNAETLLALNEPSEAQRSFKQLITNYPKTTMKNRVLLKLGLIAFNQGNNNDAIRYYKDLFNYNPNANELQEALIALEEIYVSALGQPDEFFDFVEEKSGITLNDFDKDSLSFKAGVVPYENGEYDKAIKAYSNYVDRYPEGFNIIEAYFKRGESFLNLRKYEEALNDYEYVISKGANQYFLASLHKAAVIAFYQVENFEKAFDYYSLLEEIEQDEELKYEAQLGAMKSAMNMDDGEALQYMSEKVLENPWRKPEDEQAARFNLSQVLYAAKSYEEAVPYLQQVISTGISEQSAEAYYMMANIELEQEKVDEAESRIRQFIIDYKSYPKWIAKNLILLADILVKKEDLLQARAALEAVVENYTGDEEILTTAQERLAIVKKMEEERNRIEEQNQSGELILEKENGGQNE